MRAVILASLLSLPILSVADPVARKAISIPAQTLATALRALEKERDLQVIFVSEDVRDVRTAGASGELTSEEALQRLLSGTGLTYRYVDGRTVTIVPSASPTASRGSGEQSLQLAQAIVEKPAVAKTEAPTVSQEGIPEILVAGSKILNMDIARSRDDVQPYVIFDREQIRRSGSINLSDFLKRKLTMATQSATAGQNVGATNGNVSSINLRGLGSSQTLILIDGRRAPGLVLAGNPGQSDLNTIPMGAIERIEVLPTTASGIYGGGATGGVINVILRRDYSGFDLQAGYGNTFDSNTAVRQVDLSGGFSLGGGKTNIIVSASTQDAEDLNLGARDLLQRGRARILANNPGFYLNAASPPGGATPNIRSSTGTNLVLKSGAALGSPLTHVPVGYSGVSSDGGAALVANAGRYNLNLAPSAQSAFGESASLRTGSRVDSLTATVRREFSPRWQAFVEVAGARNQSRQNAALALNAVTISSAIAANPFQQNIVVTVPSYGIDRIDERTNTTWRAVGGVIVQLPRQWRAELDYAWSKNRFADLGNPTLSATLGSSIAGGALNVVRDVNVYPLDFASYAVPALNRTPYRVTTRNGTLRMAGPVGSLPAGAPNLSVLLESREQLFDEAIADTSLIPSRSQSVDSAYIEATVPLVSDRNRLTMVRELDIQLAARHDIYRTRGVTSSLTVGSTTPIMRASSTTESTNPTLGLRYKPIEDFTVRASYGTGFLPPSVTQLVPSGPFSTSGGAVDPLRGSTTLGAFQVLTGGSPDVKPEKSESWSAGLVLTPRFVPGARLSVDYTRIEKTQNIPGLTLQQIIDNEAILVGRVTRGPLPVGDPYAVGPITLINSGAINIAGAQLEAYDAQLDYRMDAASWGSFEYSAAATWQTHYQTQLLPTAPVVENVGLTSTNPLKFKANAAVSWSRGPWTAGWAANYFDSYIVSTAAALVLNQGSLRVPDQLYHDVFARYEFGDWRLRVLAGAQMQLTVTNVLNTRPPFDASNQSFLYSQFGDPRLASYALSLKKSF